MNKIKIFFYIFPNFDHPSLLFFRPPHFFIYKGLSEKKIGLRTHPSPLTHGYDVNGRHLGL